MKPLKGQMTGDGRIFDPDTGKFTYKIEESGEVRDLQRSGGLGDISDPKPGFHIGRIEQDGRLWNTKQGRYTQKIEPNGRVWDLTTGKSYRIERYRPPSTKVSEPATGIGGGGGGGAPISVGEFPGWIVALPLLLLSACLIFLCASILIWFGLFAMCFVLIFIKPLRGILGFGIAALSLYLAVRIDMAGGDEPSNIPVWIACATLIWLAPLMALAKKPLYVFLAFVLFGIVAGLLFLGIPYLDARYPGLTFEDIGGPLGALGVILGAIVLLIIGIVIPIFLMVEAFGEDTDMYLPTTKGFPSWAIPILLLGLVIIGIAAILTSASFFAPDYVDQMTDKVIKRFLPAYKTKAERILKEKQEWELWERFASNPNKWLTAPKTSWSLPGKIIFISSGNRKLYSINPNNSKRPINLTRRFSGDIIAAAPSLDGEKIAFVANRKGESGIYVMNPNGTKITKIAQTNDGYANMGLVWRSPSVILIVRQIPPYSETIWMVEINHSQRFLAVPSMIIPTYEEYNGKWVEEGTRRGGAKFYSCTSPAVSPDGERLAYVKDEYYSFDPGITPAVKGAGKIIVRDLQDNKEFTLGGCYSATGLGPQAWSPDGSKIVFTSDSKYCGKIKNAIGILESKRNNWWSSSKITWFKVFGNNPAWSPDGNWIAFNNDGTIYALEVASGNIRKIVGPKFSGKLGQSPLWVHAP